MRAFFVLTPPESKRLIAKAVAQMPAVKKALAEDEIVIGHGTTNIRVAQEIMGSCPGTERFISGQVINRVACGTQPEEKPPMIVLRQGQLIPPKMTMEETLAGFGSNSVFIKGANAVDPEMNVGVYVASPQGGTIGYAYGLLCARGSHLIVPVGLEKLIPSVRAAAPHLGQDGFYYATGLRFGMVPIMNATVVTELQSFKILFGLEVIPVGAGGVNGTEGAVHLIVEGAKEQLDRAIELVESIKGESDIDSRKARCLTCVPSTPSVGKPPDEQFTGSDRTRHCMYAGRLEEDLPPYMHQLVGRS
ncbi:MAG: hypothetical protein V1742_12250 [Pseudomonadota bacterium]